MSQQQHESEGDGSEESYTWTGLLEEGLSLNRADQLKLVKALAGSLGMIALFPAQLPASAPSEQKTKDKKKGGARGSGSRGGRHSVSTNPLKGSTVAKAFADAKKAVKTASKDGAVPQDLIARLEASKDAYFSALTAARGGGQSVQDAKASD